MARRHWRGPLREPYDDPKDMPLEKPRMLRRGVETVLKEDIFGRSAIQSALSLPQREIEQIVGVDAGFFNSAGVVELPVRSRKDGLKAVDLESGNVLEFPRRQQG
jgi:hypothetical protein